jgi:hypothetical protein
MSTIEGCGRGGLSDVEASVDARFPRFTWLVDGV